DGPQRVDGVDLSAGIDEVRLRDLPGGGAGVSDDPPAGPGGTGDFRHRHPDEPSAAEQADAAGNDTVCPGWPEANRTDGRGPLPASLRLDDPQQEPGDGFQRSLDRAGAGLAGAVPPASPGQRGDSVSHSGRGRSIVSV